MDTKKNTPKRIYIDVTQAYVWKGRAAGIIRVMDEVSLRFAPDPSFTTTYIIWDQLNQSFTEVDFIDSFQNRELETPKSLERSMPVSRFRESLSRIAFLKKPYQLTRKKVASSQNQSISFENSSVLFMPHGGVWDSKEYSSKINSLKKEQHIKLVTIIYDFNPVVVPQFCSQGIRRVFKEYMLNNLSNSDLVLSISANTTKDAKKWLSSKKQAIPPMVDFRLGDEIGNSKLKKPEEVLPSDFIVCVGTIEARKNHTALYYAYKLAAEKGIDLPTLVIAGRVGWLAEDIYEVIKSDPAMKGKIIFLHNTSDEELSWLYKNSLFSVYPAFYEGWGLPIAESLLSVTPVACSNTSSMPEIAGDLVDYFSPYSPEQITATIQKLYQDKAYLQSRIKSIKNNYTPTTWDQSYKQVAKAIKKF